MRVYLDRDKCSKKTHIFEKKFKSGKQFHQFLWSMRVFGIPSDRLLANVSEDEKRRYEKSRQVILEFGWLSLKVEKLFLNKSFTFRRQMHSKNELKLVSVTGNCPNFDIFLCFTWTLLYFFDVWIMKITVTILLSFVLACYLSHFVQFFVSQLFQPIPFLKMFELKLVSRSLHSGNNNILIRWFWQYFDRCLIESTSFSGSSF